MALFNFASKEVTLKVVYYGPGLSGKTTNLQYLHPILDKEKKSKLLSLSTEADRTLFFDFLPVELGKIKDFSVRFQLYTVPGQVRYNATRKLVLKGADAVVFVADSQREMREQNIESFQNMRENLIANNIEPDSIPLVLQYNKRDLKNILSIEELNRDLNARNYPVMEAEAINGKGVLETFQLITKLLIEDISRRHQMAIGDTEPPPPPPKPQVKEETILESPMQRYEEARPEGLISMEEERATAYQPMTREELLGEKEKEVIEEPQEIEEKPQVEPQIEKIEEIEEIEQTKEIEKEILKTAMPEETPILPDTYKDEIERLSTQFAEISSEIASLRSSMERLIREISSLKASSDEVMKLRTQIENVLSEVSAETKESKNRHHEILGSLKELKFILSNLKTKKSWFSF